MDVTGPYTPFDNIRAMIWKFRKQKRGVVSGVDWGWTVKQEKLITIEKGNGHCIAYTGWHGDYLVIVNSYGINAGKKGKHLIHRDVVNAFVDKYGAFMFADISPEEARYYLTNGTKVDVNWLRQLLSTFINMFKQMP
jgi:hypothetical protein